MNFDDLDEARRIYNNATRTSILAGAVADEARKRIFYASLLPMFSVLAVAVCGLNDETAGMWCFLVAYLTSGMAYLRTCRKYNTEGCGRFINGIAAVVSFSNRAQSIYDGIDKEGHLRALRAATNMEDIPGHSDVHELLRRLPKKVRTRIKIHVEKELGNFKELTNQQLDRLS